MKLRRWCVTSLSALALAGSLTGQFAQTNTPLLKTNLNTMTPRERALYARNSVSTPLPNTICAWDKEVAEVTVSAGQHFASYTFGFTNVSPQKVTLTGVHTSCGCTTVDLPALPWVLAPGTNAQFKVTLNLAGKPLPLSNTITVATDHGGKLLVIRARAETIEHP